MNTGTKWASQLPAPGSTAFSLNCCHWTPWLSNVSETGILLPIQHEALVSILMQTPCTLVDTCTTKAMPIPMPLCWYHASASCVPVLYRHHVRCTNVNANTHAKSNSMELPTESRCLPIFNISTVMIWTFNQISNNVRMFRFDYAVLWYNYQYWVTIPYHFKYFFLTFTNFSSLLHCLQFSSLNSCVYCIIMFHKYFVQIITLCSYN